MPDTLPDFLPREPKQKRGREKVAKILAAAEKIIAEQGLAEMSSPKVADEAQVPVASVYQFFPTRLAILNALKQKYVKLLIEELARDFAQPGSIDWKDRFRIHLDVAVAFLNSDKVACAILLAQPHYIPGAQPDLGVMPSFERDVLALVPSPFKEAMSSRDDGPSPIRTLLHTMFAVMRAGFFEQSTITKPVADEALFVGIAYLERRLADSIDL